MAVGNQSNAAFYSISNGKICRQFKSATPNSTERVNKMGRVVYEEFYDYIDGVITDISTRDSDYGKTWNVTLQDETGFQILQMQYSSGYSNAFLKALPNADLSEKIKFTPKLTIEGDKKKTTLFLNQKGNAIKWFFTKENPNGLPELKQIKVKGKLTFDDSEIMEFLEGYVNEEIKPRLKGASAVAVTAGDDAYVPDEEAPF